MSGAANVEQNRRVVPMRSCGLRRWLPTLALGFVPWAVAATAGAGTVTVGPMTLEVPSAWRQRPGASPQAVGYDVAGEAVAPQRARVAMSAAPDGSASEAEGHARLWDAIRSFTGPPRSSAAGRHGRFHWSEMQVTSRQTSRDEWHRLYSTRAAGLRIGVVVVATGPDAHRQAVSAVEPLLAAARFDGSPAATPAAIVEAHVQVESRSITATSNVLTNHILFFGNGLVAREGVVHGPRECYALYDVARLAKPPLNYGRWLEDRSAGIVQVDWQEGPPWRLAREAGNRLSLDGRKLLPLRRLDGLRLDGTFEYRPVGDPPSRLDLQAGGRFVASRLRESMGCPAQVRPSALEGSGRYEVRHWTLLLRFDDGRVTPLPLHVESDQDLQQVSTFWLNGHDFVRRR